LIDLRPVASRQDSEIFIRLPARLGGHAAGWSVTPFADARRFFDPGFNTALAEWHLDRFLAWRDGQPVGRIAAAWPRQPQGGEPGSFGFLAATPDAPVVASLLGAAAAALRAHGASRLRGPLSFTINHEIGALVAGFDAPGFVKTPRTPPWLPPMLEASGLTPEKEVHAHLLDIAGETHRARFAAARAAWPEAAALRVRRISPWRWNAEIRLICDLYNDAWADNWGARPVSAAEAGMLARLLRPIALSGGVFIAEWQGQPIGVCTLLPNIDEQTSGLDGRLLPFGWWRIAGAAILGRTGSARMPMLGTIRAVRDTEVSRMAVGAMLSEAIGFAARRGWRQIEISWVLEDNVRMRAVMARLGTRITRTWRLYGRAL
jgi:hypothetical protein